MRPSRPISLVMWLHRPESITEFAATIWAVFQEVAAFYTTADPSASFLTFRLPSSGPEHSLPKGDNQQLAVPPDLWNETWGRYSGTVDHGKVLQVVRECLPVRDSSPLLLVVDEDLTPPEGFRYCMWMESRRDSGFVLSLSTLDPQYWAEVSPGSQVASISDKDAKKGALVRKAVVKRRARAASLLIVGSMLGLKRCQMPSCFLYEQTTSLVRIDQLVRLGLEHAGELPNIDLVFGASFPYESPDPEKIDSFLVKTPRGKLYA